MSRAIAGADDLNRGTDRRTRLLRATCHEIALHGVRGLRLQNVAAEAGVSTTLIYYYFHDRAGLIQATMDYVNERATTANLAGRAGRTGAKQLEDQLVGEFQDAAEVRENSAAWGELRSSAVFDETLRPTVYHATQSWVDDLAALIQIGQHDGSIPRSVSPEASALRLTALVEGLSNRWLSGLLVTKEAHKHIRAAMRAEVRPE